MRRAGILGVAMAGLMVASAGTAYAAFTDRRNVQDNEVQAATVSFAAPVHGDVHLSYGDMLPGQVVTRTLDVHYDGTVPADVYLDVDPSQSAYCGPDGDPKPGGAVELRLGGEAAWSDYCGLGGHDLLLLQHVGPGDTAHRAVQLRLAVGSDPRYSQLSSVDPLTVRVVQSGGDRRFTDMAAGHLTIDTADWSQSDSPDTTSDGHPQVRSTAPSDDDPATDPPTAAGAPEPTQPTSTTDDTDTGSTAATAPETTDDTTAADDDETPGDTATADDGTPTP